MPELLTIRDYEPTNLEVYRRRRGLAQHDLARVIRRSQAEVSKIENGLMNPSPEDLEGLSRIFPEFRNNPEDLVKPYIPEEALV